MDTLTLPTQHGLQRLRLLNFRSIAAAEIHLSPFTIFVGPNASGKSNVFRSLRFMREALSQQLTTALDTEGGLESLRRQLPDSESENDQTGRRQRPHLGLSVRFVTANRNGQPNEVEYGFELESSRMVLPRWQVARERCLIRLLGEQKVPAQSGFDRRGRDINIWPDTPLPRLSPDRLLLPLLTSVEDYALVYDSLLSVQVYAIQPNVIREFQTPEAGSHLESDARNLASVLKEIQTHDRATYERLMDHLQAAVPGRPQVRTRLTGNKLSLSFSQQAGGEARLRFDAFEMSDGTLRLLAILAAVYQRPNPLAIAIEEPESTIHPGAMGVLLDMFKTNQDRAQILITTHSPDILDDKDLSPSAIRLVNWQNGISTISEVGRAATESVTEGLMSAGELLRANALRPERQPVQPETAIDLFPEW